MMIDALSIEDFIAAVLLGALVLFLVWGVLSFLNTPNKKSNNNAAEVKVNSHGSSSECCANCGKSDDDENGVHLTACTRCKMVKYCNGDCQVAHRRLHKKACKKRVKELHDEELFKDPPVADCPICMLPLPIDAYDDAGGGKAFAICCGKMLCNGCRYSPVYDDKGNIISDAIAPKTCPFCRSTPAYSPKEIIERVKGLVEAGNDTATFNYAIYYMKGQYGVQQDSEKAQELLLKAAELGNHEACFTLGTYYDFGAKDEEIDKKKAEYYYEQAAMNGNAYARIRLGCFERKAGHKRRAIKHFIIAAKLGDRKSLDAVKSGLSDGLITRDEYMSTLRAYQQRTDEMKSDMRDKAQARRFQAHHLAQMAREDEVYLELDKRRALLK